MRTEAERGEAERVQADGWVVLKFGGTSVSSGDRWRTILEVSRSRRAEGRRVLLVCSALAGVSNRLVEAAAAAISGAHGPHLDWIVERHRAFAAELGVPLDAAQEHFDELTRVLQGASLLGELSPAQEARVLATGELCLTRLAHAWLRLQGEEVVWLDARELLIAVPQPSRHLRSQFLQASVDDEYDPALRARLDAEGPCLLTQGFIARDEQGRTVLLGRGGSDTSAALFAARLGAKGCEIWTDVPGMFTAHPQRVPQARLLLALGYDEAQEVAATGAKVLHPRCLAPLRRHGIPLEIRCTERPDGPGTRIGHGCPGDAPRVFAISARAGVTLLSLETVGMWRQPGFLAEAFAAFKARGLSVDLVSTSESNVSLTLDPSDSALAPELLEGLLADLRPLCRVRVVQGCATVSLVGRRIRGLLHQLGPALRAFEEKRIHMLSQASSDLNLSFVVDQDEADRLVEDLHALLFGEAVGEGMGPSWAELMADARPARQEEIPWWRGRAEELCALARSGPLFLLHAPTIEARARALLALPAIHRWLYAMKANPHPEVLRQLVALGFGLECVSPGELEAAFDACPGLPAERVLYTPNFAPREEYEAAFQRGVRVTLDNVEPLRLWPDLFSGSALHLRLDPGAGRGHHAHVRTGGDASKFGIAREELPALQEELRVRGARVVGLHAHAGSGIREAAHWAEVGAFLAEQGGLFPDVEVLDLGGGLAVPGRAGQAGLDLDALGRGLEVLRRAWPRFELWMEPGRFLVAEAGVLVAPVTQTKQKGGRRFVGIGTGMNSLIRPALYGAWHEVVNLSRLAEADVEEVSVVGPICESGDVLASDRLLPPTRVGDVLLIAQTGAYGRAMSSRYNLREPAPERVLRD